MRVRSAIIISLLVLVIMAVFVFRYVTPNRRVSPDLVALQQKSQDLSTTSKVKVALNLNKNVSQLPVDVQTKTGVVTLIGKVPTSEDKAAIEQIARSTVGVKDVVNSIIVEPTPEALARAEKERIRDLEIKNAILESFLKDPTLRQDLSNISIQVSHKVVTLAGDVPTSEAKSRVTALARRVEGVEDVRNEGLQVKGAITQDSNLSPWKTVDSY